MEKLTFKNIIFLQGIDDSKGEFRPIYDESSKFYQDTYSTGAVPDNEELVDQTIEPMYATEFIATYDWIQDDWNLVLL